MLIDISTEKLKFTGVGWMPPVKLTLGGKTIFQFTGAGRDAKYGTTDDGPYASFEFDKKKKWHPMNNALTVTGLFEMPALALKSQVDIKYALWRFKARVESRALGFGIVYNINIDPLKWKEMQVGFSFKDDFDKYLSKQALPALEILKKKAMQNIDKAEKEIAKLSGKLSGELQKAKKGGMSKVDKGIAKTKATISRIKAKIKSLKKKCKKAAWYRKADVCARTAAEITAQGTALAAQETYLKTLLKPGKKIVKGVVGLAAKATKELGDAKILKKAVQATFSTIEKTLKAIKAGTSIFKVKELVGGVKATDLAKGKIPLIKRLFIEINIPGQKKVTVYTTNVEFDFKDPIKSTGQIINKLLLPKMKIGT